MLVLLLVLAFTLFASHTSYVLHLWVLLLVYAYTYAYVCVCGDTYTFLITMHYSTISISRPLSIKIYSVLCLLPLLLSVCLVCLQPGVLCAL